MIAIVQRLAVGVSSTVAMEVAFAAMSTEAEQRSIGEPRCPQLPVQIRW